MSGPRLDPNGMTVRSALRTPVIISVFALPVVWLAGQAWLLGGSTRVAVFLSLWACALLIPALVMFLGAGSSLVIDRSGFTVGSLRPRRYRWRDAGWFRTGYVPGTRYRLGYTAVTFEGREIDSPYSTWQFHTLPNYRLKASELAEIMNRYRERAAGAPG